MALIFFMPNNNYRPQLWIDIDSTINSIQQEFNACYPFLKIGFLKSCFGGMALPKGPLLSDLESSKKLDRGHLGTTINIDKKRTVAELEKDLESLFGMPALVFRRSGNVWVETSLTEDWTLEEQNKEGEQISFHFH